MIQFDKITSCRYCGASIIFAENALSENGTPGAIKPIDVLPAPGGNLILRSKRFRHLHLTDKNIKKIKSFSGDQIFIECRFEVHRFMENSGGEPFFQFHYKSCKNKPARRKISRFAGK